MAIVRFVDIVGNVDLSFRFIVVLFCLCSSWRAGTSRTPCRYEVGFEVSHTDSM